MTEQAWEKVHEGTGDAGGCNEFQKLYGLTTCQSAASLSTHILQMRTLHTDSLSSLPKVTHKACSRPVNIPWEMQVSAIRDRGPFIGPRLAKSLSPRTGSRGGW